MEMTSIADPGVREFAADTTAAGHWTLGASLTGFADKTTVLGILTSGTPITTKLTFP